MRSVTNRAKYVCHILERLSLLFKNGQARQSDAAELRRLVVEYRKDAYNLRTSLIESGYTKHVDKIEKICLQYTEIIAAADRIIQSGTSAS